MEVQSTHGRLYASTAVRGWKSDSVSLGVLLDKYREKQRHGGSNEMKIKGHSATTVLRSRVQRGDVEKTEIRF